LVSFSDVIEDPTFWHKYKDRVVNLTDYLSCLFEDIDKAERRKNELRAEMPKSLNDLVAGHIEMKKNFYESIQIEKEAASQDLMQWMSEIQRIFGHALTEVEQCLDVQYTRFEDNLDFLVEKIKDSYAFRDYPQKDQVLTK